MVPIPEGTRRRLAPDCRADHAGDVMTLLLGGGSKPRGRDVMGLNCECSGVLFLFERSKMTQGGSFDSMAAE
jgi:hypothetical protein